MNRNEIQFRIPPIVFALIIFSSKFSVAKANEITKDQYQTVQNLLTADDPKKFYFQNQLAFEDMARQPESGQMLKDGFEKLGNPKWSMPITDKIKLRNWDEPDVEDDDGLAAGHLKQAQKIMPTNLESSGSWKWLGLAAMVAFVCADYIKDKRFVITGSKF